MKHIKLFEQFINEARAIPVTLEPKDFNDSTSIWGIYQKGDFSGVIKKLLQEANYK